MTAISKALLVSAWQPTRPGATQSGLYRRLTIMIDAIKQNCSTIEALFFLRHQDDNIAENQVRAVERDLSDRWEVDVRASFCRREPPRNTERFDRYLQSASSFFRLPGYSEFSGTAQIAAVDDCLARNPDIVFIHRLQCMTPLMLTRQILPPVFFDIDDIEHVAMLRHLSQPPHWWRKNLAYLQLPALLRGERNAIKLSFATLVCSDLDRDKLMRLCPVGNIMTIPNAVTLPVATNPSQEPRIVMLGNYEYSPNRLGAEFFLDKVWPIISAGCPSAEAIFAGHRVEAIRHFAHPPPQVTFPGFVEDLDELYRRARIVICPILTGGGTRVKIMEAAAYGRPVVSTCIGAEGIDLIDGKEIILRDSAEDFANACTDLLKDYEMARILGLAVRSVAECRYDRSRIVAKLAGLLHQAVK
ncbi:glycosyltransferase [Nitrosospira sp. NRS527]|uniref:glycosyltransferase n=1 Tax=Nitrosospira sp. NRS527 TaxID=155925 RepID=UPI001BCE2B99|nr:glycosyltransferase [Nitrosospira sp. NRS527]